MIQEIVEGPPLYTDLPPQCLPYLGLKETTAIQRVSGSWLVSIRVHDAPSDTMQPVVSSQKSCRSSQQYPMLTIRFYKGIQML